VAVGGDDGDAEGVRIGPPELGDVRRDLTAAIETELVVQVTEGAKNRRSDLGARRAARTLATGRTPVARRRRGRYPRLTRS
jgi:hypothetical protein